MIELPELVIWSIADHLSYEDIRSLRVTCKRLKRVIDEKRFKSLHLFVEQFPMEWDLFETDELVDYPNTFRVDRLDILSSTKFKTRFSSLAKLTIYFSRDECGKVNMNDLNYFVQLVHLEIVGPDLENGKLSLPNLKIVRFGTDNFNLPDFELDCPQLTALCLADCPLPKLTSQTSSSIRHLYQNVPYVKVAEPSYRGYELGLYEQLTSVSTVSFKDSEQAAIFVRDLIDGTVCLPSLKRIQLKEAARYNEPSLESFILFKSRKETRNIEFQINRKMMDLGALIELRDLILRNDVETQPSFPSRIEVNIFTHRNMRDFAENPVVDFLLEGEKMLFFDYNEDAPFFRQLIGKPGHLVFVEIGEEVAIEESLFEYLLQKGRRICQFSIRSNRLTQQQLDRMPGYLTSLRRLDFLLDSGPVDINFNFLTKFNLLSSIAFRFNLRKDAMSLILKRFKREPSFSLEMHGAEFVRMTTRPNENGRFQIILPWVGEILDGGTILKDDFVSLEDAIDFYYENDLFNNASVSGTPT